MQWGTAKNCSIACKGVCRTTYQQNLNWTISELSEYQILHASLWKCVASWKCYEIYQGFYEVVQRSHKTNCTGLVQSKWLMALVTMDIFPEPKPSEALATDHLKSIIGQQNWRTFDFVNCYISTTLTTIFIDRQSDDWYPLHKFTSCCLLTTQFSQKARTQFFGKRPEVIKTKNYWSRNQLRLWLLLLV